MAEEGIITTNLNAANGADTQPVAGVVQQYIKDLSVENPNAPDSFQWPGQPDIDVQFNIASVRVNDELHEVELKVSVSARAEQGTIYAVELSYCGLIGMRNMPDDQSHAFLYAEAPRFLFPFARQVIAEAVRDAGYAPLMLDPIDFQGLYLQQLQQRYTEQQNVDGAEGDSPVGNS